MPKYLAYPLFVVLLLGPLLSYVTEEYLGHDFLFSVAIASYFVFLIFILLALTGNIRVNIPLYLWFFLAFTVFTVLSDAFIKGMTIDFKYLYSNAYLPAAVLMIMIENVDFSERYVKLILYVSLGTLFLSVIVIAIQQVLDPRFFVNPSYYNLEGTTGIDARLPSIYSWLSPVSTGFTFISLEAIVLDDNLSRGKKNVSYFLLLASFLYSFISKARWILVNSLVLVFLFWVHQEKGRRLGRSIFIAVISFSMFFMSLEMLSDFNVPVARIVEQRYLESKTGGLGTGSSSTRILAFVVFAEMFPQHPFLGAGSSSATAGVNDNPELAAVLEGRSSQIHVGYLSLFFFYGVVGGMLYVLFLYFLMRRLYIVGKTTGSWGAFFAILGFLLANLTLVYLTLYEVGIVTSLVYYKYSSQSLTDLETETTAGN